jgi:hypothetical protein
MEPITDEQRARTKRDLWASVLVTIGELPSGRYGTSRSQAFWSEAPYSTTCLCIASKGQADGSDIVYHIEAQSSQRYPSEINTRINTYRDNHDEFWRGKVNESNSRRVIVGHRYYSLGDEYPKGSKDGRGFSGRLFKITMTEAGEFRERDGRIRSWNAGETIETTNLWSAGIIAPAWRDQLPDNAEFVPGFEAW